MNDHLFGDTLISRIVAWALSAVTAFGVAVLIAVTMQISNSNADLSETLNRRSPVIEHIACYETRLSAYLVAQAALTKALSDDDFSDATPASAAVLAAQEDLSAASLSLSEATDPTSAKACPSVPKPKSR